MRFSERIVRTVCSNVLVKSSSLRNKNDQKNHAQLINLFLILNSAEHEIFSVNKYENANNSWHFHIN